MRECPNPECRSTEIEQYVSHIAGSRAKMCLACGLIGPWEGSEEEAIASWDALPRVGDAAQITKGPEIVTLCGSSRFKEDFIREQARLTDEGKIFLTLGFFGHLDFPELMNTERKEFWDELHKRKIDISNSIFVINKDGYIGESTRSEIDYAISRGKAVYYMEPLPSGAEEGNGNAQ